MPELKQCEYYLVDYVPSPLRRSRVAIGLFLFEAGGPLIRHGFAEEWHRVRCLDPQADLAVLAGLPAHFEGLDTGALRDRLRRMQAENSGAVQIAAPKGVLTADAVQEFNLLFQEHVATPRAAREKRPPSEGSRPWIHAQFCEALRRHALWERFAKDVRVTEFTAPGDGFRVDFSYRPNGVTHYVHAVSLERDWNHAKLLSYTFWKIREKSQATMTAIVAGLPDEIPAAQSCREILTGAEIGIQPLSQLDPYLAAVSRDLHVN